MNHLAISSESIEKAATALHRAIQLAKSRAHYQTAVEVCSSARALWARFYNAWFEDDFLKTEAAAHKLEFQNALDALKTIALKGCLEEKQANHVALMIRNTAARIDGLDAIENASSRGEAVEKIDRIYEEIGSESVDSQVVFSR